MRYRCERCGTVQWRGFFPQGMFQVRYVVFHGVAVGAVSVLGKALFLWLHYSPKGVTGALASLAVGILLLLLIYGVAVGIEAVAVSTRGCVECGSHRVRL